MKYYKLYKKDPYLLLQIGAYFEFTRYHPNLYFILSEPVVRDLTLSGVRSYFVQSGCSRASFFAWVAAACTGCRLSESLGQANFPVHRILLTSIKFSDYASLCSLHYGNKLKICQAYFFAGGKT